MARRDVVPSVTCSANYPPRVATSLRHVATYLRRHHVAFLALLIALSGTAYAAGLPRGSVGTAQLRGDAITSTKVRDSTISGRDLRNGTVDATDLAQGAVTGPKLGSPLMVKLRIRPGDGRNLSLPSGTALDVPWEAEVVDTADMWDPANPSVVTIPRDGIWLLQAQVAFGTSGNGFRHVWFRSTDTDPDDDPAQGDDLLGNAILAPTTQVATVVPVSAVVEMDRGETFTLTVAQNSQNELSLEPPPHSTTMTAVYLGAAPAS